MQDTKTKLSFIVIGLTSFCCSHSVSLSNTGFGEVLIYPYYTVNNNLDTLFSVVNVTSDVKAVKVKFLEGDNNQEVLNFNLYLSPFDVWAAALSATEDGAQLFTVDSSCSSIPNNPQPFLSDVFLLDAGSDNIERVRDGHFQIIEMATITDATLGPAAIHINGTPVNCSLLDAAWEPGGQWDVDASSGVSRVTGGLSGSAVVVDVGEGTAISYKAETIVGFFGDDNSGFMHTSPDDLSPSLAESGTTSKLIHDDQIYVSDWDRGIDAVSALFMHDGVFHEYVLNNSINAKTEIVITYPTKQYYTDPQRGAISPFTSTFDDASGACENINEIELFDREESYIEPNPCGGVICPFPFPEKELCWATNIIQYYNSALGQAAEVPSPILGSTNMLAINTNPLSAGWATISYRNQNLIDSKSRYRYEGYPGIGFSVQKYTNTNAQPGLLAQYAALFNHSYSRSITSESN